MKKICSATSRPPIEVINKNENIIVNCTPSSFLMLRNYVKVAINSSETLVMTDLTSSEDQTSANVMDVISVRNQEQHTAVINIYPTTHRFMINGRYSIVDNIFNDTITMIANNPNIKKMDRDIQNTLQSWMEEQETHHVKKKTKKRKFLSPKQRIPLCSNAEGILLEDTDSNDASLDEVSHTSHPDGPEKVSHTPHLVSQLQITAATEPTQDTATQSHSSPVAEPALAITNVAKLKPDRSKQNSNTAPKSIAKAADEASGGYQQTPLHTDIVQSGKEDWRLLPATVIAPIKSDSRAGCRPKSKAVVTKTKEISESRAQRAQEKKLKKKEDELNIRIAELDNTSRELARTRALVYSLEQKIRDKECQLNTFKGSVRINETLNEGVSNSQQPNTGENSSPTVSTLAPTAPTVECNNIRRRSSVHTTGRNELTDSRPHAREQLYDWQTRSYVSNAENEQTDNITRNNRKQHFDDTSRYQRRQHRDDNNINKKK